MVVLDKKTNKIDSCLGLNSCINLISCIPSSYSTKVMQGCNL